MPDPKPTPLTIPLFEMHEGAKILDHLEVLRQANERADALEAELAAVKAQNNELRAAMRDAQGSEGIDAYRRTMGWHMDQADHWQARAEAAEERARLWKRLAANLRLDLLDASATFREVDADCDRRQASEQACREVVEAMAAILVANSEHLDCDKRMGYSLDCSCGLTEVLAKARALGATVPE